MTREVFSAAGAGARLERASAWLSARPRGEQLFVVGATHEAAAELARAVVARAGSSFGWERATLGRLAVLVAAPSLAERGLAPASALAVEALWTRVVERLKGDAALGRFSAVADRPGLPRALARTARELRLARTPPESLDPDLGRACALFEQELQRAGLADPALLYRLAIEASPTDARLIRPFLLLDVPVRSVLERELVAALCGRSQAVLATVPAADGAAERALCEVLAVEPRRAAVQGSCGLHRVQRHLFSDALPPPGALAEDVVVVSAPGEASECVELARRILREAEAGVPFDRMAILLRAGEQYRAHVAASLRRADVPAYFARGTQAPDPAGRALLALLRCAEEGLSARRFAEYLSLGQVPEATSAGTPPAPQPVAERWAAPEDEHVAPLTRLEGATERPPTSEAEPEEAPQAASEPRPVLAGTLRAPRRWEQLLVEAAVIGGMDRWRRRLAGLRGQLTLELEVLGPDDPATDRVQRNLADLEAFCAYALPLLEDLDRLPTAASWGVWLEALGALATRALRRPERVLGLLTELGPMAAVGPVGLREVRAVLAPRLVQLMVPPPDRREGRVFVGPIDAARGLTFDVVLVPGLAERVFPAKLTEDPILPDRERARLAGLETAAERAASERLALSLAVGAATRRLVLSYPRLELEQSRPRVPSFYGLEVLRAGEGRLPGFSELMRRAEAAGQLSLGWPAPEAPLDAIDEAEHDLALLGGLRRDPSRVVPGAARFLVAANVHLGRALRFRARRWLRAWTPADGLFRPIPEAHAALKRHAPAARAYSPTALQHYASCPYRFLLHAIFRLSPRDVPEPVEELDPLQRGSLVHDVQFELLEGLRKDGRLPVTRDSLPAALDRLEEVVARVSARYRDDLLPAIERVWQDTIAGVRADVRVWLQRMVELGAEWEPWRFELSFGLPTRQARDPESQDTPVELDIGVRLRGSIDLVERARGGELRATDYKTGRQRAVPGDVIRGGETLQPVLYALALEKLFPKARVVEGRLYYCTQAGGYQEVVIPLNEQARAHARAVVDAIGKALEEGFVPAAPKEDACTWCDYRDVCGPSEEFRTRSVKRQDELAALEKLRRMR